MSDEQFMRDISGCNLGEKVYYRAWRVRAPHMSFRAMLQVIEEVRNESEQREWEIQQEDDAYFAELDAKREAEEKAAADEAWYEEQKKEWAAAAKELAEQAAKVDTKQQTNEWDEMVAALKQATR